MNEPPELFETTSADCASYLMARGGVLVQVAAPESRTVFTLSGTDPEWVRVYNQGCGTQDSWVHPRVLLRMRQLVAKGLAIARAQAPAPYRVPVMR
jgi:hypothetical protein